MSNKSKLLALALLFCSSSVFAQGGGYAVTQQIKNAGYSGVVYDATNGLPSSDANFLMCSSDGYMWIGSYSGVIRFDGTNFDWLSASDGLTSCRAFFEDSMHRIWVGTNDNGVVVIDGEKQRHYTYKDGLPSSSIRYFAEDAEKNIFIATTSGLAYVTESGIMYHLPHELLDKEKILKLVSDSTGKIYGQTTNGIVFAIENETVTELYTSSELNVPRITTLLADPKTDGDVYLCCEGGIMYHGAFGNTDKQLTKINISPIDTVQWISYDCDRIWICTNNELAYLDTDNRVHVVSNLPVNSSIEMMTSDYQGNMWVSSSSMGVMKIVTNNFVNKTREASLEEKPANAVCLHNNLLYIGTETGLHIIDKNNREIQNSLTKYIADSRVRCIIEDEYDNIWVATYTGNKGLVCQSPDGKLTAFTTKNGMSDNKIRNVMIAQDGSILCGSNGGLTVIKDGQVVRTYNSDNTDIIKNTTFLTIEQDDDGTIYAGSDGDGLYVISDSDVRRLGRDDGLTSDVIMRLRNDKTNGVMWIVTSNSMQYMKDGIIHTIKTYPYASNYDIFFNDQNEAWILTAYGLVMVSTEDLIADSINDYKLYGIANGLPSAITANSYSQLDTDGNLYLCCRTGIVSANINKFAEQNTQPRVVLNSIYCGNEKILPDENNTYIIPATNERIVISTAVLDYTMSNPMVRVYLDGAEDEGITVTKNELTSLEYTSLPYGDYQLHIQILSNNKKRVLYDTSYFIIKKFRLAEFTEFKMLLISLLVLFTGFIVWRIMKSTVVSWQEKKIQEIKEEVTRANTTKSRFLSNMSQEIITPLNTIMCMDEMILREKATDVPKEYFNSIKNYGMDIREASESLLNLINDLLEMSKIETGDFSVSEKEYDVNNLLHSLVIPTRLKAADKNLTFTVSIDETIPQRLSGDIGKIRQILLKLLSNAVAYTERGGIEFTVYMKSRENESCTLRASVKDTGNGVRQEITQSMFDAYAAYEHSSSSNINLKTGLSLDISKKFATLMGGDLTYKTEVGKGSEFIFTLTQKIADTSPIGVFAEKETVSIRGEYKPQFIAPDADVLVASANALNLDVLDNLLKPTKVFITRAHNKQEFFDKLKLNAFNVAFIDQMLFEESENEINNTLERIRKIDSMLPVYILTENSLYSDTFYKEKGFSGTLALPVDSTLLEKIILQHLPEEIMDTGEEHV